MAGRADSENAQPIGAFRRPAAQLLPERRLIAAAAEAEALWRAAGEVAQRVVSESRDERFVRAVRLGVRLLEQGHPQLGRLGGARVQQRPVGVARQAVVDRHATPAAFLPQQHGQLAGGRALDRRERKRALGEATAHRDDRDRRQEPAAAEASLHDVGRLGTAHDEPRVAVRAQLVGREPAHRVRRHVARPLGRAVAEERARRLGSGVLEEL